MNQQDIEHLEWIYYRIEPQHNENLDYMIKFKEIIEQVKKELSTTFCIEKRLIKQEWYETDTTKTGWDSHDWFFMDDRQPIGNEWTVVEHLDSDKFGNPILGVAEKITLKHKP